MTKYGVLKRLCFVCMSILLLSGCNMSTSQHTKTLDKPYNSEDNVVIEETTNDLIENELDKNELCGKDEDVLFRFKIADSDKIASVCISKQDSDYIIYRFGKPNDIELEFPDKTDSSWDKFTYSYYLRGGGAGNEGVDLNYLEFENGNYKYNIYQEYDAQSDETMVGITVTDLTTGEETDIQGDNKSITGSLIPLRDNNKIKTNLQ